MIFKKCPNCDMENPETEIYCLDCGTRLDSEKRASPPPGEPAEVPPETPPQPEAPPAPAAPEAPAGPPTPPSLFGERYKVLEVIGTGPTGIVYKVFDKALERELALKSLGPEFAERRGAFEGFSRELRVERGIVHKNIARLFELNVEKDRPFITMEFVSGQTLEALMKEKGGPLPVGQAVGLAGQLTRGLAELHRKEMTHVSLRPRNIMVDKEGTLKIMDLGLSSWLTSKGFTVAEPDARSAHYVSPEEVEGRIVDSRSDIFALGAIIYEILTGVVPSSSKAPEGAPGEEIQEALRNPHDLNPLVPPWLGLIVLRCLARDPDQRYQTANDLGSDLEKIKPGAEPKASPAPVATLKERPAAPPPSEPEPTARPAPPLKQIVETRGPETKGLRLPAIPTGTLRIILIAAAVIVLGAVVWRLASRPGPPPAAVAQAPAKISVAVLPFEESGATKDHAYFGEGLAEALIGGLRRLPGLRLAEASSASFLRTKGADNARIGQTLGAGFVLRGTFEPGDTRLRISAQLIKAADGSRVWESQFDRGPEEVLGVLRDIAGGIVQALKVSASPDAVNTLFNVRAVVPEACDLYFRGRSLADRGARDDLEKAAELFQQAAAKDPGWAAVPAGLANTLLTLGSESLWSPDKAFTAARQALLKAMELEPGRAEARLALAILKWRSEWDFADAEKEFREALRVNPEEPEMRRSFALFLSSLGRHDEAQSEIKAARDIDPLSPRINDALGMVLYYARQYDLAAQELTKAQEASPSDFGAFYGLGLLHLQTGDLGESLRMFQQAAVLGGDPRELSLRVAVVLARLDRRPDVGKILSEAIQASSRTYVSYASLATVYAGLMEPDQAAACLEKAYSDKDASLVFLKVSPLFDTVRGRPWFADLVKKIGL